MGINGHDPLAAALERANQEQQAAQMQALILQQAVNNPHTIERINVSAVGVAEDADGQFLLIATPDGRRRDVKLSPETVRLLRRALAPAADLGEVGPDPVGEQL